jgi:hypothetical protein
MMVNSDIRRAETLGHYGVGGVAAATWHMVSHPFRFHRLLMTR